MPSQKIYDKRHERRAQLQQQKRTEIHDKYNNSDVLTDINVLIRAYYQSKKNVSWKPSIQQFEINLFRNIIKIIDKLMDLNEDEISFYTFTISERGKIRLIQSVNIEERVLQHALCDEIVYPYFTRSLIYDNGASLVGKGTEFAINRLKTHLSRFYRYNGLSNDGYILLIDFSQFFASISHTCLENIINKLFTDEIIKTAIMRIINSFGDVGLGLGSQLCQLLAIYYINAIDHYIKEVMRVHYYGRYMDDSYLIFKTYEECEKALQTLIPLYEELNITVNIKKTKIVSLKDESFTFLKKDFRLTETGKIIIHENTSSGKRLKHKMKKLRNLYIDSEIELAYVLQIFKSWKGTNRKYTSKRYLQRVEVYVLSQFPELKYAIEKEHEREFIKKGKG